MKYILFLSLIYMISCSPASKFKKDKDLFDASAIQHSFKSVADMNDSYFVIKENNFFEFYRQLFDSVKNTSYPGKYTKSGDTLILSFYDKKGYRLLGRKALVVENKNQVIFFK